MNQRRSRSYLRRRCVSIVTAFGIALVAVCASAADVTFKNDTKQMVYIKAGDGNCTDAPPLNKSLSVNPKESGTLSTAASNKMCYVAAHIPDVLHAPRYCGSVVAPVLVVIADNTPVCQMKPKNAKATNATLRPKVVSKSTMGSGGGNRQVITRKYAGGGGTVHVYEGIWAYISLAVWNDPLTPPQTAAHCTQEAWGDWPWGGQWRVCVGWGLDCQWMQNELVLAVRTDDMSYGYDNLKNAVTTCLNDAVIAGTIAGIIETVATGGVGLAAAEETFRDIFFACIEASFPDLVLGSVSFEEWSHWTSWSPCT